MKCLVLLFVIFVSVGASKNICKKKSSNTSVAFCNTANDKCLSKAFSEVKIRSKKCNKNKPLKLSFPKKYSRHNETFCGSDGIHYQTFTEAVTAAYCNSVQILHKGACGHCNEQILCSKSMRKKKTLKTNDGVVFKGCCEFKIAACKAFHEKNQVMLLKN